VLHASANKRQQKNAGLAMEYKPRSLRERTPLPSSAIPASHAMPGIA
jgi:hypothetical protein